MAVKILCIAGTFFQRSERLGISHQSETKGGTAVKIIEEAMSHAFSGYAATRESVSAGYFEGTMIDTYGASEFHGMLLEDKLTFRKYYLRTGNGVSYTYKKSAGGLYIGTYEGDVVPQGITRCLVTELSAELFALNPDVPIT